MKRASRPTRARVVIDTNAVLSSLLFSGGYLATLRAAWQIGRIHPVISRETAAELMRVLTYPKFKLTPAEQEELLADYLPSCEIVVIPNPPPKTPRCRDSFDVPFLQLAVAGMADALITGDKDLLCLAASFVLPILTAEQFLVTLT